MARCYTIPYSGTLANAGGNADLLSIQPADDKPVRLLGMVLSQISEVADAAEEGLRISVHHYASTFTVGSGGSAVTPAAGSPDDTAFGGTARCNDATVSSTSGTDTTQAEFGWNVRAPFEFWWPERFAPEARQGAAIVVRLETTPADDITAQLLFFVEEL